MLLGPALQVKCPFCKGIKQLSSLMSGNTFHAVLWTDTKLVNPMLIRNSPVQQCPHCGKYFFLGKAKQHQPGNGPSSMDTGKLTFEQSVEALNQLYTYADSGQEFVLRLMVLHSFNDIIRKDIEPKPNGTQIAIFTENCRQMIAMKETKDTLKAELYREIGEFDKCIDILNNSSRCSPYEAKMRQQILGFASEHDAKVRPLPRFQDEEDNEASNKGPFRKGFLDRLCDLIFDLFE